MIHTAATLSALQLARFNGGHLRARIGSADQVAAAELVAAGFLVARVREKGEDLLEAYYRLTAAGDAEARRWLAYERDEPWPAAGGGLPDVMKFGPR